MAEEEEENNSKNTGNGNDGNPNLDPSQVPGSPYYLHPGENLGAVLIEIQLTETNYYNWSKATRRALSSKKKIRFIDGDLPAPPKIDPLFEAWETCNNTVVSWITRTLSPNIAQSTISIDNARDLWLNLQDRYSKGNHFWISNLLQELHSMKQDDRTLSKYFTDMKKVWDELEHLKPTPSCSCTVPCTYALSSAAKQFKDTKYVICV